jgi:hypothetical protein
MEKNSIGDLSRTRLIGRHVAPRSGPGGTVRRFPHRRMVRADRMMSTSRPGGRKALWMWVKCSELTCFTEAGECVDTGRRMPSQRVGILVRNERRRSTSTARRRDHLCPTEATGLRLIRLSIAARYLTLPDSWELAVCGAKKIGERHCLFGFSQHNTRVCDLRLRHRQTLTTALFVTS